MRKTIVTIILALAAVGNLYAQHEKRNPWDAFITPKVGANYSNFVSLDGQYKLGVVGGVNIEVFLLPKLAFDTELSFAHQGAHAYTNPKTQQTNDMRLDYLNTDYLFRWYPFDGLRNFNIFTGVNTGYIISASVNGEKVKREVKKGTVSIPVGLGYDFGPVSVDAKFQYALTKVARTEIAKKNLGDARVMAFWLTLGYKIQVF